MVDLALTELVRAVRLRRDVEAYASTPPSDEEIALSRAPTDWSDLADDTDWAALYVGVPEALEEAPRYGAVARSGSRLSTRSAPSSSSPGIRPAVTSTR